MPKKERRAALFSALSLQAKEKNLFALEGLSEKAPKTKKFAELLAKLPEAKKYLFVLPGRDEVFEKSAANVPNVEVIFASYLNPYDLLHAHKICFVSESLKTLEDTFLTQKK